MREYQRNWYKITESHNWIKESSKSFETTTYLYPCHIRQFPWQVSGVTQFTRAANWRNQGTMVSLIRQQVPMTPSRLEPLWQDTGDSSQPDPQSWPVSGTQSQPSRNPGRSRDTKSAEPQILALTVRASTKLVRQCQVH